MAGVAIAKVISTVKNYNAITYPILKMLSLFVLKKVNHGDDGSVKMCSIKCKRAQEMFIASLWLKSIYFPSYHLQNCCNCNSYVPP